MHQHQHEQHQRERPLEQGRHPPAFLDLRRPGQDRLELCRQFRQPGPASSCGVGFLQPNIGLGLVMRAKLARVPANRSQPIRFWSPACASLCSCPSRLP